MTAYVIFASLGLLAFALILHLFFWRIVAVRREMLWLFVVFFGIPLVPLACLYNSDQGGIETLAIALLWFSLASAYVQTYPVLRHVIPSFRILLLLDRNRRRGLHKNKIMHHLAQEGLFASGLDDLEHDSLIVRVAHDRYVVTRSGAALARFFGFYRRLLGLAPGEG